MSICARQLSVGYGQKTVINSLNFDAKAGDVTAIVGPNGSGKSTLLKAICGDLPYTGRVTINGMEVASTDPAKLAALRGVLPQASTLAFPFTAVEVVRIGLTMGAGAQHADRPLKALDRVGLLRHAGTLYQELSGGEQQRVQLARVLAQVWYPTEREAPRWLVLDEPVSSLDIAQQLDIMRIAKTFAQRGGGVVAVMHDLNLTGLFADEVVVMSQGQCLATGPAATVMSDQILSQAYGCAISVSAIPENDRPFVLPHLAEKLRSTEVVGE